MLETYINTLYVLCYIYSCIYHFELFRALLIDNLFRCYFIVYFAYFLYQYFCFSVFLCIVDV